MLIGIRASKGANYIQLELDDIERIIVNAQKDRGELHLKKGPTHLLSADEAQRVVDAMRKADDEKLGLG